MSIEKLKEDIKSKKLKSLYLFHGPEEYLKKYYAGNMESILINPHLRSLNLTCFEGKLDAQKFIESCDTLPVFSERRMVLVKNSGLFKPKKKSEGGVNSSSGTGRVDEDSGEAQGNGVVKGTGKGKSKGRDKGFGADEEVTAALGNLPHSVCVVFVEESVDKRLKSLDVVKKAGLVVEFEYQKAADLVKWVQKVFKASGKELDPLTAAQFVENCEPGMTDILNEANKVILYLEDRNRVTADDLERVCVKSIKSRIFDLLDAVSAKNSGQALKLLDEMIRQKEPVQKILFMIAKQLRILLQIKLLSLDGQSTSQIQTKLGLPPFVAGKTIRQASGFSQDKLRVALKEALEMDLAIKTGRIKDRMAAEILITGLAIKDL